MNDVVNVLGRWMVRLVLLAAGLVFLLGLLSVACVLAAAWGVRALWARWTGRPVAPWVMPMRARTGWSAMYRARTWGATAQQAQERADDRRNGILPGVRQDVSDVQPREVPER